MGNFLIVSVGIFFDVLSFAIILQIFMSWMPSMNGGRLKEVLNDLTGPILSFFKKIIPPIGMIDISPIVALFVLDFIRYFLINLIAYLL